jgi:hypothetical protein
MEPNRPPPHLCTLHGPLTRNRPQRSPAGLRAGRDGEVKGLLNAPRLQLPRRVESCVASLRCCVRDNQEGPGRGRCQWSVHSAASTRLTLQRCCTDRASPKWPGLQPGDLAPVRAVRLPVRVAGRGHGGLPLSFSGRGSLHGSRRRPWSPATYAASNLPAFATTQSTYWARSMCSARHSRPPENVERPLPGRRPGRPPCPLAACRFRRRHRPRRHRTRQERAGGRRSRNEREG